MSDKENIEGRRSVVMSGYKWKEGNGGEIINDIRRSYNLYKRPRFQKERDIEAMDFKRYDWSWRGSIPGAQRLGEHPTSLSHNVKSRMAAVAASQREQGEADWGRSARPDAIAPVAFNPSFDRKRWPPPGKPIDIPLQSFTLARVDKMKV